MSFLDIIETEMRSLEKEIEHHMHLYYDLDRPELEDFEYDKLIHHLIDLEKKYPEYASPNSPTKRVGGYAQNSFKEVSHVVQMASLQDVFTIEEVKDFDQKVREVIENPEYVIEQKIDGLSISLEYQNGRLIVGSTRGNGFIGEDVTENAKTIKGVPTQINDKLPLFEVRGEVYMTESDFESLVRSQENKGEVPSKNPRNAAAGSLRQKDSKIAAQRGLSIFCFNLQQCNGRQFITHSETLEYMRELGFPVSPDYYVTRNIEDAIIKISEIGQLRGTLGYGIDGAVIKVNNLSDREKLGSTAKYPKWAIAFKYPPEEKETVINNIILQVGRTGVVTPTAEFNTIQLAGTSVSRATLHNQDFIKNLNVNIGDSIIVRKAGEIIPEVVSVKKHLSIDYFHLPEFCPSCGSKLEKDEDIAAIRCPNVSCPSQIIRSIIHFCSRNAMDIEGIGESIAELLVSNDIVTTPSDIYHLTVEDFLQLDGFANKKAENIIKAINNSKNKHLNSLIYGLGIRNIGEKAALLLANRFNTLNLLCYASKEEILSINGFGEIMADSVISYFSNENNIRMCNELIECGVNVKSKEAASESLKDYSFVITGSFEDYSRNDLESLITENGGKVSSSVSAKTSFLVLGTDPGSKYDKAKLLGTKIIDEKELMKMIERNNNGN